MLSLLDVFVLDLRYLVCLAFRHKSIDGRNCSRPFNIRSFRGSNRVTNRLCLLDPDRKSHVVDGGIVEVVLLGHGA